MSENLSNKTVSNYLTVGAALFMTVVCFNSAAGGHLDQCVGSANEIALLDCRTKQYDQVVSSINNALDKLRKRYESDEPDLWKLLTSSQENWGQYSNAECRLRTFESRNGKAFRVYWLSCLTELSRLRSIDLLTFINNP